MRKPNIKNYNNTYTYITALCKYVGWIERELEEVKQSFNFLYFLKNIPDNIKFIRADTGQIIRCKTIDEIIWDLEH